MDQPCTTSHARIEDSGPTQQDQPVPTYDDHPVVIPSDEPIEDGRAGDQMTKECRPTEDHRPDEDYPPDEDHRSTEDDASASDPSEHDLVLDSPPSTVAPVPPSQTRKRQAEAFSMAWSRVRKRRVVSDVGAWRKQYHGLGSMDSQSGRAAWKT
ncbi:Uu.00g136460.m01.CDS01 [Anthostomella pinea]|uniref:Uu.00g136460.m01.CDS01 n=1 Tax=Anthostomella pinea TaxID=933095 RepID=A0AAI8VPA6_9PEZI|nr:Uu.00g136460.m01.CDS01 [Anthostomella pinea]